MPKVKVNGNERTIAPFSAAKAIEATILVGEILQRSNGLAEDMAEKAAAKAKAGTVLVPRAVLFYRDPEGAAQIPDDAWAASGQVLALPGREPSGDELFLSMLPQVMRIARDEVLRLLALVLVPETELVEAEKSGGIEGLQDLLARQGRDLMHELQLEELFSFAASAWEATQEQLKGDPTARAMLERMTAALPVALPTTPTASPAAPSSSTGSPASTGGRAKRSSTKSRGASSKRSTPSS